MKKIIAILFVIFLITGCKKEDPYKDLPRTEFVNIGISNRYKTIDRDETYIIARLKATESYFDGLFLQIPSGEYVMLYEFSGCNKNDYFNEKNNVFSEDKLYVLRCGGLTEYTLLREKTTKKTLKFEFSDLSVIDKPESYIYIDSIDNIIENNIYLTVKKKQNGRLEETKYKVKCSLETYICELIE